MNYGLYSIRDIYNGFSAPMCDLSDGSAVRNFKCAITSNGMATAADYDLFRVGTFDLHSGSIVPESSPVMLFRGSDLKVEVLTNE